MTNQEEIQNAIEWIEGLRNGWNDEDNIKYCNMAIKALEQTDVTDINVGELISRQAVDILVDELARVISDERCCISRGRSTASIMQDILDLPSVEPERKPGKWHVEGFEVWCTNCGFHPTTIEAFNYCPKCGAKMEVE